MAPSNSTNGWSKYEELILDKLEVHSEYLTNLAKEVQDVKIELTRLNDYQRRISDLERDSKVMNERVLKLQFRSGLWGAVAGAIPVLITALLYLILK